LDSTNIVDAEIAVLTNVDLEHTEVLGPTRGAIATEKLGILKSGATLVTGIAENDELTPLLVQRVEAAGARLVRVPLLPNGLFEAHNLAIAGVVLDQIGILGAVTPFGAAPVSRELLTPEVVKRSRLPGRLER